MNKFVVFENFGDSTIWSLPEDIQILDNFYRFLEFPDKCQALTLPHRNVNEIHQRSQQLTKLDIGMDEWSAWSNERKLCILKLAMNVPYEYDKIALELNETIENAEYIIKSSLYEAYEKRENLLKSVMNGEITGSDPYSEEEEEMECDVVN